MCFSKTSSATSYLTGSLLSLVLYFYGDKYDKHIAAFSLVFIQMQLAEYFMWSDQDCGKTNHYASVFAHFVLLLQPISVILFGYIFNTFILSNKILYILFGITLLPLFHKIYLYYTNNNKKLCTKEEKEGYLEWNFINDNVENWNNKEFLIYFIFLTVPWLALKDKLRGIFLFLLIIISYTYKRMNFSQWESTWCYSAVKTPLIFITIMVIRNLKLI